MIAILAIILFVLMLVVGGERGATSIMALAGNIIVLTFTIILLAAGYSPFFILFLATVAISCISLFGQNGKNVKTKSAFMAVIVVMFFVTLCIYFCVWKYSGGGLNEIQSIQEDVMYYYNVNIQISMMRIAVSVTILSALGAAIDTALSVTSAVHEVAFHKKNLTEKELFHSGIQVGKEIIGTTVNTLLFAYLGESLLLFAYLKREKFSLELILNSKFLFHELSVMLFGAITCLLIVPVSAYFTSHYLAKKV